MRAPRVWIPEAQSGEVVEAPRDEAYHLVRVLRRTRRDPVEVADGRGNLFQGAVERVEGAQGGEGVCVWVRVGDPLPARSPPSVPWSVAVAPAKSRDMDVSVRLASELGLERLVPLVSDRAQVEAERSGRVRRWERIAREAAKQCGRARPLDVAAPRSLDALLGAGETARFWIAAPGARFPSPAEFLDCGVVVPATFLVGPEGGFSESEERRALESGARPLGFPTPVLRTPTAIVFLAALGALIGGPGTEAGEG